MVACRSDSERTVGITHTLSSTLIPSPTTAPTNKPTVTTSPTATSTQTIIYTPTITPTPTQDLSFYDTADCLPKDTGYQKGTVINIIDGDTIEVQFGDEITATVRYLGIDAPENGLPLSDEARQANSDMVLNKVVVLVKDQSDIDQFDRLLRYAVIGDLFVNQELVRTGHARAVNYPPDEACDDVFISAEQEALLARSGMWAATPTPVPYSGQVIILAVNKREEWVDIQNVGDYDVDLAGWNLVSERGGQDCPLTGILQAGQVLRIWAMAAQGPGFSCGYDTPIWNNSQTDPAVLYNAQGVEASRK
ncbi:MAG TPA: thermonuclease family protein [Anaerolineales bacterium]|nr:thermonuclease family protein [Anaerolineales bacterium]